MDMSDPASSSDAELEEQVTTLATHLYAGTCRWLQLVGELDVTRSGSRRAVPRNRGRPGRQHDQ